MPPSASSPSPERAQQQDQHRSPSPARAAARVLGKLEKLQAKVRRELKKRLEFAALDADGASSFASLSRLSLSFVLTQCTLYSLSVNTDKKNSGARMGGRRRRPTRR